MKKEKITGIGKISVEAGQNFGKLKKWRRFEKKSDEGEAKSVGQ